MLVVVAMGLLASAAIAQDEMAGHIHVRFPDREFLQALDLSLPGLREVAEAVQAEDWGRARAALATYYRSREGTYWWFDPHAVDRNIKNGERCAAMAQRAIERTGEFDASRWLENGELDWLSNPSHANWARMYNWQSLGMGYWYSGQEHPVATVWVDLLRSWVKQVPPGSSEAYWNTMTTGIRMRSGWPHALNYFLLSPTFTDDDMVLFLKSTLEQTRHLREHHSRTSNWLTFEMAGLYSSGVLYPEFRDAADWRRHAAEVAVSDMDRGYLPDGASIELCPGYHQFFSNYLLMHDLAKVVGRQDEDGLGNLVARCEAPYDYYVKLMAPDRRTPAYNDNRPVDVVPLLDRASELFPDRAEFRWIASDGQDGHPPEYASYYLPFAGAGAMRSGWERDANYLGFDFGPVGYRHAHQDKLSIVVWAYGREILFDPGKWDYSDTPLLRYCSDTFSHNTALVDNRPQRRKWYADPTPERMPYQPREDVTWRTSGARDYAAGVYDEHYGKPGPSDSYPYKEGGDFRAGWGLPATHHRRVLFVKPDLFVVADTLVSKDGKPHQYDVRWHLDSTNVAVDDHRARTTDADLPNLAIVPLAREGLQVKVTSAQTDPEPLGWKAAGTAEPATTIQHIKSGDATVRFVTLLVPLRPGRERIVSDVRVAGPETTVVDLADGRRIEVVVPRPVDQEITAMGAP